MPIYEYDCPKCGKFELIRKFSDPPVKKCPTCKKAVKKLMSNTSFQLKGSGWYITDYARKGSSGPSSEGSSKSESSTPSETTSKSEAKGKSSKGKSESTTKAPAAA